MKNNNTSPVARFRSVILYCMAIICDRGSLAVLRVPGMRNRNHFAYVREGDINIGHLVSIHGTTKGVCTGIKKDAVLRYKAMEYAVDEINKRQDLLPNVSVGFVQMDDCWNGLKASEAVIYFVKDDTDDQANGSCDTLTVNSTDGGRYPRSFDVVGVIGPSNSGISTSVAKFLGAFNLSLMSLYATANTLSDKTQYPYFMRLVPPDLAEEVTLIEVIGVSKTMWY
jgi:vomeronasal 2 receptor